MGYYCSCADVKFFMKSENIEGALRLLAPTQYGPVGMPESDVLAFCDSKSFEEKRDLFDTTLSENGYRACFDDEGNVVSLSFENEKWYDDTDFFDVFAKYVEKGSYIEMNGEDGAHWRMIFDGEHCCEIEPIISWPEYDEVINGVLSPEQQASDFIEKNPALARAIFEKMTWNYHREDILSEISQNHEEIELTDADIDTITDNFERNLSKNDSYFDAFWESAYQVVNDYVKEHPKALDDVIKTCEGMNMNGEPRSEREINTDKER